MSPPVLLGAVLVAAAVGVAPVARQVAGAERGGVGGQEGGRGRAVATLRGRLLLRRLRRLLRGRPPRLSCGGGCGRRWWFEGRGGGGCLFTLLEMAFFNSMSHGQGTRNASTNELRS